MKMFTTLHKAIREVLWEKKFRNLFILLSIAFAAVLILIPVFTIQGNDLLFQLSVFTLKDYVLISVLSILVGLMISMQIYSYQRTKRLQAGKSLAGSSSGIVASLFGTAGCSSCLASIFGFLGVGNVFVLLEYQTYVVAASLTLILVSLYFTARKINCDEVCK